MVEGAAGVGEIAFTFEGRRIGARSGQSLAAALIAAGERGFRETAQGGLRSVFCGMGVCQDCLVEIDGQPNRRACMEKVAAGLTVRRQAALARLDEASPAPQGEVRVESPDVAVVGGGAAGLEAAIAAASAGARVLVLDERPAPGGQYYKQAVGVAPLDRQQRDGAALVARALAAGAELRGGVEVWGAFDGPLLTAAIGDDALIIRPRTLVVATGAYERPLLVPGWDLPGVMTTGAAQTLWRSYRTLPGARVVVAGSGPLNVQVALELAKGGARLAAVCEAAPSPLGRLGIAARMIQADPALAAAGAGMLLGLAARGVRVRHATVLERIERAGDALAVTLVGPRSTTVIADAVLMNDGFQPSNEILRLLGCQMDWDERFAQLRPVRSADCATSIAGVFAVGDCCGLGGAPAAVAEGRIAGAAAARPLGFEAADPNDARRDLARARAFQDALWRLHAHPPGDLAAIPVETIFCRCEEVTKGDLDRALAAEPGDIGAVKRATRIGMGRCQGRYCGPALVRLLAEQRGQAVVDHAFFAPRAPVKPVRISAVLAAAAAIDALGAGD